MAQMLDLTKKSDAALMAEVSDAREALRKFQFQMAGGKAKNVREGRALKKQIARVLTEMNKRKIQKANSKV